MPRPRTKRRAHVFTILTITGAISIAACSSSDPPAAATAVTEAMIGPHPRLLYAPSHKDILVARQDREPFATVWRLVRERAARPRQDSAPESWDAGLWQSNATTAQANAIMAWALGDAAAAAKAKELLLTLDPEFEKNTDFDVDIRMVDVLLPYTNTLDLLLATPWISADEARAARARITTVARKFAERYLDQPFYRATAFILTQNNHPLRAASALGYVALAFPDDPDARRWLDWSTDQLDYLLGPKGHYVQSDGGVSEGPFYFSFGFAAVVPFLIALDRNSSLDTVHHRTCITRNDADPWTDHGCVEGEPFTRRDLLRDPAFANTLDWSVALRRPSGLRATIADSTVTVLNGGALLTAFGGASHLSWDWQTNAKLPLETRKFNDLAPWYLAYVADVDAQPPPWRNRFFPAAGHAVFRSGWGTEDRWLTLVADHGPARKSLHNHADGASFALSAYGEDLLIDTGYYKPNNKQNPLTTDAPSHNVLLVDGAGAPKRGLLNEWGDTDAFLENTNDGEALAWAEARTQYEGVAIRRGVAFARKRYFVVADRTRSEVTTPRAFQWRAHLWGGHDAGGRYTVTGNRVILDRASAGLEIAAATTAGVPSFVEPPFKALQPPHVHQLDGPAGNHTVLDATIRASSPGFLVVLAPFKEGAKGADGPLVVTASATGSGAAAWSIEGVSADGGRWRDVAWLRDATAETRLVTPGGHALETDAELVIVAESGEHALVAGGTKLLLDGVALVQDNTLPVAIVAR